MFIKFNELQQEGWYVLIDESQRPAELVYISPQNGTLSDQYFRVTTLLEKYKDYSFHYIPSNYLVDDYDYLY